MLQGIGTPEVENIGPWVGISIKINNKHTTMATTATVTTSALPSVSTTTKQWWQNGKSIMPALVESVDYVIETRTFHRDPNTPQPKCHCFDGYLDNCACEDENNYWRQHSCTSKGACDCFSDYLPNCRCATDGVPANQCCNCPPETFWKDGHVYQVKTYTPAGSAKIDKACPPAIEHASSSTAWYQNARVHKAGDAPAVEHF